MDALKFGAPVLRDSLHSHTHKLMHLSNKRRRERQFEVSFFLPLFHSVFIHPTTGVSLAQ